MMRPWNTRPTDGDLYDHSHEYVHSNVLGEGLNKSLRSKPFYDRIWFIAAELAVITASALCLLYEFGLFDK